MRILSAKYVVTMAGDPIIAGAVAIEGTEILDVGREQDMMKRYPSASHEDYPHHVIMPGLINGHTSLDLSLYKDFPFDPVRSEGLAVNYIDWLMGCFNYKKTVSSSQMRQAVETGIDQCLEAGTTCVADMSRYEGIFQVFEQKNMRAVVCPEILSVSSQIAKDLFETALAIIEKYIEDESDLIHVGAGPFSAYTLSRNILRIMSQYSRSSGIPLMIHAAESFSEMEFFNNSTGDIATKLFPVMDWPEKPPEHHVTPLQYLAKIGFLEAKPMLVGCTQVTSMDMDLIASSGSKVVITPRSSHNLQQGKAPYREMVRHNILTVLGTGGMSSVDSLSLWDEMRAFVAQHEHQTVLSGSEVLAMVTTNAALALGLHEEIGSIEKGKSADLLLLDISQISTDGDFVMNLIKGINNYHVKSMIINGVNVKSMN